MVVRFSEIFIRRERWQREEELPQGGGGKENARRARQRHSYNGRGEPCVGPGTGGLLVGGDLITIWGGEKENSSSSPSDYAGGGGLRRGSIKLEKKKK